MENQLHDKLGLHTQMRQKQRPKLTNPLQKAMYSFLTDHVSHIGSAQEAIVTVDDLIGSIPKRFTIYPPLLLLPLNFFTATPAWTSFTSQMTAQQMDALYQSILEAFKSHSITHIALNSPISPTTAAGIANVTRSPTRLVPLIGDFGPRPSTPEDDSPSAMPAEAVFTSALWISAVQNGGIHQVWAPLHTMFSRGNVREKARILGHGHGPFEGLDGPEGALGQELWDIAVVDMYVGIGYFAFSYLKRGVRRVWGWEVNGWSVEGLTRGCRRNGWGVRVLRVGDEGGEVVDEEGRKGMYALEALVRELERDMQGDIRMVVCWGDNRWARGVIESIRAICEKQAEEPGRSSWLDVRHINLGLLPTSRLSWEEAIDMLDPTRGGWVHVHENVDVREMEQKRDYVVGQFRAHLGERGTASCAHIEQVKTYAPGVTHCVFDVYVQPKTVPESSDLNASDC